jgi:cyclopropane fatty-acyl-phospholipid synthase-like methyltransferase
MTDWYQAIARKLRWRKALGANRNQYKQVWTALSQTENDAKFWVQNTTDEATLAQSAAYDFTRLLRGMHLNADSQVLEIGCGVGRLGQQFAPQCHTWTGCDVSPNMLQHAQRRLAQFDNVRLVEISGYDLRPIADETQDVIYSTVVFMHLAEWDRYNYILEAKRALKPGGQLYIDNVSLTTDYGWKVFEMARAYPPGQRPAHVSSASTPQEFEAYLSRAGFSSWQVDLVDDAWVVGMAVK